MATLVCNQACCSNCANPSGQCYCHAREQLREAVTANFGDAGNASVAAAYKTLLAGDDADPSASKHAMAALGAIRDGDSDKARKLHLKAAKAHDDAAEQAEADGESKEARSNRIAAGLHRKAAAVHGVQASTEDEGEEDATMNTGQPRHPHTGQYQGMTHTAAKRGASADQDDEDGADDLDDVTGICPHCAVMLEGGQCQECGWKPQPMSNKRRKEDECDDDDKDEDGNCKDDDEDDLTDNAAWARVTGVDEAYDLDSGEWRPWDKVNRRWLDSPYTTNTDGSSDVSKRSNDDLLMPPATMQRILIANEKAQGSNADLIGDDDSDYGYSQAGTYGRDQRTVHSVSEVFGFPEAASPNLFGASMSPEDVSRSNAAKAGFTHYDHEQDDEGGEIGQGDRPSDSLDTSRKGTKTDYPGRPRSRDLAGSRTANSLALDAPLPPTTAELCALNRQERRQQRRRFDRSTGRMVVNKAAPGDSYDLPTPTMID